MKRHSSIFNFDTLRPGRRPMLRPMVLTSLLAIGVILLCELAARWSLSHGVIQLDPTIERLVDVNVKTLREQPEAVWLLGNSTLARGVDGRLLQDHLGRPVIKLAHGSATVTAAADMLDYYLQQTNQSPRLVVVCVTKDDLNSKGFRAEVSRRYRHFTSPWFNPQQPISILWASRESIKANAFDGVRQAGRALMPHGDTSKNASTRGTTNPPTDEATVARDVSSDQEPEVDEDYLLNLARDFKLDLSALPRFSHWAAEKRIGKVVVVLMPVTDRYRAFHDEHHPELPVDAIMAGFQAACDAQGLTVLDLSRSVSGPGDFTDLYHLSNQGRQVLTPLLAHRLTELLQP